MKITNEMLEQFMDLYEKSEELNRKQKEINNEMDVIKILIKEKGSCSTKDYVAVVEDRVRKGYWVKATKFKVVKVSRKAA